MYASSSAPDTDFFAHLADEDISGRALEVSSGMVRARYRNSESREEILQPGRITEFHITLAPTACLFRKGHRIRLEITSSNFPNYDRNHNTGRNDITDTELKAAGQTVWYSRKYRSRLMLPAAGY